MNLKAREPPGRKANLYLGKQANDTRGSSLEWMKRFETLPHLLILIVGYLANILSQQSWRWGVNMPRRLCAGENVEGFLVATVSQVCVCWIDDEVFSSRYPEEVPCYKCGLYREYRWNGDSVIRRKHMHKLCDSWLFTIELEAFLLQRGGSGAIEWKGKRWWTNWRWGGRHSVTDVAAITRKQVLGESPTLVLAPLKLSTQTFADHEWAFLLVTVKPLGRFPCGEVKPSTVLLTRALSRIRGGWKSWKGCEIPRSHVGLMTKFSSFGTLWVPEGFVCWLKLTMLWPH